MLETFTKKNKNLVVQKKKKKKGKKKKKAIASGAYTDVLDAFAAVSIDTRILLSHNQSQRLTQQEVIFYFLNITHGNSLL